MRPLIPKPPSKRAWPPPPSPDGPTGVGGGWCSPILHAGNIAAKMIQTVRRRAHLRTDHHQCLNRPCAEISRGAAHLRHFWNGGHHRLPGHRPKTSPQPVFSHGEIRNLARHLHRRTSEHELPLHRRICPPSNPPTLMRLSRGCLSPRPRQNDGKTTTSLGPLRRARANATTMWAI